MDKKEQPSLMNGSSAYMRFKLKTLLKRQIKGQRKFQKHLADLKLLIDKYVSGADSRERLLNTLSACLRTSQFHVDTLRDFLFELHSPRFIEDEPQKETMKQEARRDDVWAGLASQLSLLNGGSRLNPLKGEVKNEGNS